MTTTKTITDYPAAVSIDASADYLLLEQGGAYKRINRTVFTGITGDPIGTTDSQVLTNKTIGNTNTATFKDTLFTLQDDSDTTKQAQFQLSGITTGTTRVITMPDASITIVGTTATQTLTNKTLTSPAITGGTIDNSTITVDSIAGHTTAGTVTVGGLQITSGVLNTNNSVVTTNLADGAVTPAKLVAGSGTGWAWQSWTPTWTNLTVGNGNVVAKYVQTGKKVTCRILFTFGSTSAISGDVAFTLPVTANAGYSGAAQHACGNIYMVAGSTAIGVFLVPNTTQAFVEVQTAGGTYVAINPLSSTVPFTWASTNWMAGEFYYEAA